MIDAKQENSATAVLTAPTSVLASNDDQLTEQDKLNFASRWIENSRFIGSISQATLMYCREDSVDFTDSIEVNYEVQLGNIAGNGSGFLMGLMLHWMLKDKYQKKKSVNPLYRNFKTLASFGFSLGIGVAKILPMPSGAQNFVGAIIADIASLVIGLFAIPYWLVRQYVLKTPDSERNVYTRTGTEGWSKYGKTFLVYGASLGQVIGAIYSQVKHVSLTASMAIVGGITSIASFVLGMVLVPVINKFCSKAFVSTSKDTFRNNYVRSGMTLGMAVGTAIGFALGSLIFPGLGSAAGMVVGAALGSVIGGVSLGACGNKISKSLQKNWNVSENTDNSWDYATRSASYLCAFLGSAIGFFIPVPGGALIGAALGGAIGGAIGWVSGLGVIKVARTLNPEEEKSKTLPWSQRMASGSGMGSLIGGTLGFLLGLTGGPMGALLGAALGSAIGGFIGGICGTLYDKRARKSISQIIVKKPKDEPTESPEVIKIEEANPNPILRYDREKPTAPIPIPGAHQKSFKATQKPNILFSNHTVPTISNNAQSFFASQKKAASIDAKPLAQVQDESPTEQLRSSI